MRGLYAVVVAGIVAVVSAPAWAVPISFVGTYTIEAHDTDPGLVVQTQKIVSNLNFSLDEGETYGPINLFKIWTEEGSVNPDDLTPYAIKVTYNFTQPVDVIGGPHQGTTVGSSSAWGIVQHGKVTWTNPLELVFGPGNTGKLLAYLSDEVFNKGIFGLGTHGAKVQASFKLETSPVPIPPALALFAAGVAALGAISRRRKARAAATVA